MTTWRTDPLTGKALIHKDNVVQKDGFTNNERAGEYGTRKPKQPKKTKTKEGDPKEAIRFMRAAGLHGLADMYETNGNAAKEGKIPPVFSNNEFFSGVKIVPEGENADSNKTSATVGDAGRTESSKKVTVRKTDVMVDTIAKNIASDKKLPMPNILHDFASYNNLFSFGCLSAEELNFPDRTYRKNGIADGHFVLRSAGGLTADQKPRTSAEQQYNIDAEYYIDSVNIEEAVAPNRKTRHTNFHSLDFQVREPYSMGQFLETLYRAAKNAGYNNYLEAPWLLQINFVGHQDVERTRPSIAASKKQLVVKLVNIVFDVDTEGSIYTVTTAPYNESIFSDQIQSLPVDITVSGDNLVEIMQSGVNSVTTHINTHLLDSQKDEKTKVEQDEYIIAFPNETSSASIADKLKDTKETGQALTGDYTLKTINYGEAFESAGTNLQAAGYNAVPDHIGGSIGEQQKSFVNNRLGFSVKRGNLSETLKTAISAEANGVNSIGYTKIRPEEPLASGDSPFSGGSFIMEEETRNFSRGGTTINPRQRTIQFRKGTKIQRVIEELVLLSRFGQRLMDQDFLKAGGKITWFRIESSCYIVQDKKTESVIGRMPKIYVYRVVPYDVNTSFFQMPNDPPPGYGELVAQAPKAYNYMYTGKNLDVLEFSIKFDNAFYKAVAMDMGNRSGNNRASDQAGTKEGTKANMAGGVNSGYEHEAFGETSKVGKNLNSGESLAAGNMTETPEVRLARMFNESLVESDVDLVTVNLRILGDPFYISDSGIGNYVSEKSVYANVKEDGTMDHQSGKVDILLNFQTPIDLDDETGGYLMNGPAVGVSNFNGLYFVTIVRSRFEGNMFTQELELVKRQNWKKRYLAETNQKISIEAQEERELELKKLKDIYGEESDVYQFAQAQNIASKSGNDAFDKAEIIAAGFSDERAQQLQTAWKSRKPPPAKTVAEIAATDYAGGDAGGEFGATPKTPPYDDAILRVNRANNAKSNSNPDGNAQ